ncbi:ABC transporter permease [Pseudoteredinibacter isoporae]|uniref:Iron(III) transport system permease protein n=1 Tax=Pseudoteredinibacter isoporae TaxID=570281 RepID=A0A7X0JYL8_9GAMM|nr:iron ABC transporter permease [Pseudoteredinibacter isoporae]MBB6523856.1 iron(III) transport system permease protein [Pseudoteredinibacter isoporae]NHO89373.1 iron ABC transporter permease [Pseudoteredinibacter isoporae]NIB22480.1 iron ABC transporter permease [Pseudoteredinibacter isoporae]
MSEIAVPQSSPDQSSNDQFNQPPSNKESALVSVKRATWRRQFWRLPAWFAAGIVLMPILVIVLSWSSDQSEIWAHLIQTQLGTLLSNTLKLCLGVGAVSIFLGVSLAWLVSVCEFPGRRWLDWGLMLPLAIPTYVVAFVALGLFDFSGPVQTALRDWLGSDFRLPSIRSAGGVSLVLSAVLYPYVYMLSRSAFMSQGRGLVDAARMLGRTPLQAFWHVALPMARPAIAAGAALALMETLADFGAVAVFNYDTFTTAIYKSWFGFFNLPAAAQLASVLLLFVALALFAEQKARGGGRLFEVPAQERERFKLKGARAYLATAYCALIFVLAFVVPVGQLLAWVVETRLGELDQRYLDLITHTFMLGLMAALLTVGLAILVAFGQRQLGKIAAQGFSMRAANLGYALPGTVLAVGIMLSFAKLDAWLIAPLRALLDLPPQQILVGSVFALVLSYCVRFFTVGLGPIQSSFERLKPSFQEAAQSLGANKWQVLWRVYLPMLSPGILSALLLVLVDVMKEMPATLLLRPFGWDTLAVRVYEMTSEGEWERAALPALTLVLLSLGPVVLMIRRSRR